MNKRKTAPHLSDVRAAKELFSPSLNGIFSSGIGMQSRYNHAHGLHNGHEQEEVA